VSPQGLALAVALALLLLTDVEARADAPSLFGLGARSAALARADVAGGQALDAPRENAAAAADPGVRFCLGYGASAMRLTLDGRDASVPRASGVDLGAQIGVQVTPDLALGMALSVHIPDQYIAWIGFRPATEPQFVLYEAPLQRTAVDAVAAVRHGPFAIGAGVAVGVGVGGRGIAFELGQDGGGAFASARLDAALPYRLSPIAGIRASFRRFAIGASVRGPMAIDLRLDSEVKVALRDNPLGGTTTVHVRGPAGFDPAAIDVGAQITLGGGFAAMGALEYAVYSAAPPPVADVVIDVKLGVTPSQREARFPAPRFRDTITPRFGVELRRPVESKEPAKAEPRPTSTAPPSSTWRWAVRAGYALSPSPVPAQTGFTSYADATRHLIALGGGYHIGRVAGVDLAIDLAGQVHLLNTRVEEKKSASLPYARFEVGGRIFHGAATLEATWQ
jgi:hypothetical protein